MFPISESLLCACNFNASGVDLIMEHNIDSLIQKLLDKEEGDPYKYGDLLVKTESPEARDKLIEVVKSGDMEAAFVAAKVLGQMKDIEGALEAILEVIHLPANKDKNGGLVSLLGAYDLTDKFVDIFRIYLFGNFKASTLAKEYLDYTEFDIASRTLKKAENHWNHYANNAKADGSYEIKAQEVAEIFKEIRQILR